MLTLRTAARLWRTIAAALGLTRYRYETRIITMLSEPDTMTLVSTMISLAHSLRLKVVAEGVDEEEQARMLRLLHCDEMQGYLFSKPLPLEELAALLGKQSRPA